MIKKFLKLELDFDFTLIGITSQLRDYRLCFTVNKFTETDFRKIDELEVNFKNTPSKFFSRYLHIIEDTECEFYLIANKGNEGYLISEMKEVDYFVIIREFIDDEDLELFISRLKQIDEIQAVVELNPSRLKSKENLLF